MKLKIIKIFFILLCLSLFSCKKKVDEDYRPEFIGDWWCPPGYGGSGTEDFYYNISIDNNSNAVYSEYDNLGSGGPHTQIQGKARANNYHFKIGRIYSFKIEEYPHKIDTATSNNTVPSGKKANWKMTLSKTLFHLGAGTYYKADY
jgi:hypothetical protein